MGTIAAMRQQLADVLTAAPALAGVKVWPYAQPVEVVQTSTVIVGVGKVEPSPVGAYGRTVQLELWLLSPATETGSSDTALEDQLEQLLTVLDDNGYAWSSAEPGTWRDTHPAYRIEIEES